jgi:O-antigen/teichoic acid export membrane protein
MLSNIFSLLRKNNNASLHLLAWRLGGVGLLFFSSLIMTNFYSQAIVGDFEFVRSILLLLGSLVIFGADHSMLQIIGVLKSKNALKELTPIYIKFVIISLIISVISLLFFVLAPSSLLVFLFKDIDGSYSVLKVFLILFFYAILHINAQVFRAFEKHLIAEIYRGVFKYSFLFVGTIALLLINRTEWIVNLFLISFLPLALWTTIHVRIILGGLHLKTEFSFKKLITTSFPMATSDLGFFLLLSIDILFLNNYYSEVEIAVYAQPIKIITIVAVVQTTLQAAVASRVSELFNLGDRPKLVGLLAKTTRQIVLLSIPVLLINFCFPQFLLSIFGESYISGSKVLMILTFGVFIGALCSCSGLYLNMTGRQSTLQYIIASTILLNLLLNYILIPNYGIIGAAIASCSSVIFWNIIAVFIIWKKDGFIIGLQ